MQNLIILDLEFAIRMNNWIKEKKISLQAREIMLGARHSGGGRFKPIWDYKWEDNIILYIEWLWKSKIFFSAWLLLSNSKAEI